MNWFKFRHAMAVKFIRECLVDKWYVWLFYPHAFLIMHHLYECAKYQVEVLKRLNEIEK